MDASSPPPRPLPFAAAPVKRAALDSGFDLCGVARAEPGEEGRRLKEWLARGYHGAMKYMEERREVSDLLPGCRSVVALGVNYFTDGRPGPGPRLSRYAWGDDYHFVLGGMLRELEGRMRALLPGEAFLPCCDSMPVMEKAWAERAGIGWIGKNGCLVSRRYGSWIFLALLLTTAEIEADAPHPDRCGRCDRCLHSCPTGAFVAPRVIDARRCIPYLTIEQHGPIRERIAPWVFGCDACQEVCPWNRRAKECGRREFAPRPGFVNPDLRRWIALDRIAFRALFRDSPLTRPRLQGIRRNAKAVLRDLQ